MSEYIKIQIHDCQSDVTCIRAGEQMAMAEYVRFAADFVLGSKTITFFSSKIKVRLRSFSENRVS